VTSGRFTDEAINFASGRNVRLVDGPKLRGLIQQAQLAKSKSDSTSAHAADLQSELTRAAPEQATSCPVCAGRMVRRTARRGTNAGSEFWGCTGYPACRGTRAIP
jgi:restriction system protein